MKSKYKCYVNFLGCEKRKLDTQRIIDYLRQNGFTLSPKVKDAHIVIFVTCGFCEKYEDWSISKMEKIYKQKDKNAIFVICGCLTSINPERLKQFPDAIHIPTRNLEKLDSVIEPKIKMEDIPDTNITLFDKQPLSCNSKRLKTEGQILYERAKKGFKIRINWGCLGNCSYCVTKLAEQRLQSKPKEKVIEEFNKGLKEGYKSFFITGGDVGAYGIDRLETIVTLLEIIFKSKEQFKLHFQDFGIHWLYKYKEELIPLFKENSEKLGCICLPIQSGSNRILNLMNRPYIIEKIVPLLTQLKEELPNAYIGTHFIVGFPGETEEDFEKSVYLVQKIKFDFLNVFIYTDHKLAESYLYPDKVPNEIAIKRYKRLIQVFEDLFIKRKEAITKNETSSTS